MNNYHGFFTYEGIQYSNKPGKSVAYLNCVMLKDIEDMKKGMKIPYICISYGFMGWNEDNDLEFDCSGTDTRTGP